ncbi:MAG: hypothetical protein AAF447_16625 [Myxococcota bacterium]
MRGISEGGVRSLVRRGPAEPDETRDFRIAEFSNASLFVVAESSALNSREPIHDALVVAVANPLGAGRQSLNAVHDFATRHSGRHLGIPLTLPLSLALSGATSFSVATRPAARDAFVLQTSRSPLLNTSRTRLRLHLDADFTLAYFVALVAAGPTLRGVPVHLPAAALRAAARSGEEEQGEQQSHDLTFYDRTPGPSTPPRFTSFHEAAA